MIAKYVVLFALIFGGNADLLDIMRPKTVRIYKFRGVCPEYPNLPIIFKDVHIGMINRMTIISLKVIVKETITSGVKVRLNLKRCQSREALDSCESYQSITINRMCDLINAKNKPWSPFVEIAEPPFGCPLKKGTHIVKNGTFDGSAFSHFPIAGWYWIVQSNLLREDNDKLVMCMILEGQIVPI